LCSGVEYYNERLLAYSGRKVIVRQRLLSDAEVLICDLDDRYLFTAAADGWLRLPKAAGGESFDGADAPEAAAVSGVKTGTKSTVKTVKRVKGLFDVEGEDEF
jgi:hypothetical protein